MHTQTILVTGGAGYIGSHVALLCAQQGYKVVVLDDSGAAAAHFFYSRLKTEQHIFKHYAISFIRGAISSTKTVDAIFKSHNITAVMHCAAFIDVGQSVTQPLAYYHNNVAATLVLIDAMIAHNIKHLVFSSSCAVYGQPEWMPLTEDHPKKPLSPYGKTKLMVEMILEDCAQAYNFSYVALRYFNAAGATPELGMGECHEPETHLIPLLLRAAQEKKMCSIFGTEHATPDGTCVRDFLHVQDIADAHVKALAYLQAGEKSDAFNVGTGKGISVRQMIDAVCQVTGVCLQVQELPARPGDPAFLVADAHKALQKLGWQARHSDITTILHSAAQFYAGQESRKAAQMVEKSGLI